MSRTTSEDFSYFRNLAESRVWTSLLVQCWVTAVDLPMVVVVLRSRLDLFLDTDDAWLNSSGRLSVGFFHFCNIIIVMMMIDWLIDCRKRRRRRRCCGGRGNVSSDQEVCNSDSSWHRQKCKYLQRQRRLSRPGESWGFKSFSSGRRRRRCKAAVTMVSRAARAVCRCCFTARWTWT